MGCDEVGFKLMNPNKGGEKEIEAGWQTGAVNR